ncbi:immunoglobulin i-set domain-containing protein [Phthorimaea operculella]|nr:immunoglobulin i-set domain-containing protein [Phthorimaea operculella]
MAVFKMEILTLLFCISSLAVAQRTPTISHITQEQIRDIGGQVDLDCSVHYAQDYPVLWVKYDRYKSTESLPLSTNSGLIIRDSRFSLRFDDASATYTLSIKDIQENDAGWYQCQVLLSVSNKITAEVELQVRRPPIISDNSTRALVASEGESTQMNCYAGGFPPPKISWRRENNAILPTGGSIYRGNTLKIASVHKEDRGTYYCVAENGVGKGARRNINLEVEFAPVVTVPRPRLGQEDRGTYYCVAENGVGKGARRNINLEVEFAPVVTVPRPRLGQEDRGTYYCVAENGVGKGARRNINLEVEFAPVVTVPRPRLGQEDRGTYYCVAENGVGKGARRNINLEVEFAPVVTVPRPRLGQALQYDMDLECHVEAYPPPAITWLKDEVQLSNNQHYRISHFATADEFTDTTLRVITIEKRQYGLFTCKAQNKLGTDQGTVELFETIIPVCPPACGQARYGGAAAVSPDLATVAAISAIYVAVAARRVANPGH